MNLHHPLWDQEGRTSPHAQVLLQLAQQWQLQLATPWGEPTRQRHTEDRDDRDGTIDHAWFTRGLRLQYRGGLDYAGSDHIAQLVQVYDHLPETSREPTGWAWAMMDTRIVQAEAEGIRPPSATATATPRDLDATVDQLIQQLQQIADLSTPRRRTTYGHGEPWWDRAVDD